MSSVSDRSVGGPLGGYARKLTMAAPKQSMHVHINNHYKSKVYSSGSAVSGVVTINVQRDTRFDALQISLFGTSKTRIDGMNIPSATRHTFLRLNMPIPESTYPVPRIFEAGRSYTVPFNFVIPDQLTINACNHRVLNDPVQDYHVRLPPTLGSWEKDDLAPDMTEIQYAVKARAFRDDEATGSSVKIMCAAQAIKVLPAHPEDPPLNITENDKLYTMCKTKTLRKTILSAKSGKVAVSATQPAAAMLRPDGRSIAPTAAQVEFTFEPTSSESVVPKVTSISSKVTAVTYFSSSGIKSLPNLGEWNKSFTSEGSGSYSGNTSLKSGPTPAVAWKQHIKSQARRDSGYCSELQSDSEGDRRRGSSSNSKRKARSSPVYYTGTLQVPVQLPADKKTFIPTFHSCIMSRVYVLWLTVSMSTGGTNSSVTLGVPLQVGVEPLAERRLSGAPTGPPTFEEAAQQDTEIDEYLRPRVMSVPEIEFQSSLPGYGDLMTSRTVAAH